MKELERLIRIAIDETVGTIEPIARPDMLTEFFMGVLSRVTHDNDRHIALWLDHHGQHQLASQMREGAHWPWIESYAEQKEREATS